MHILKSLELHKKFEIQVPNDVVSAEGINSINAYLTDSFPDDYRRLRGSGFAEYDIWLNRDWPKEWILTGGKYAGTFPKRVGNFLYKERGIKASPVVLQTIGNIAKENCSSFKGYSYDFDDHLDWDEGRFGDNNSCYWGDRAGARDMLRNAEALAMRFYDQSGRGKARAWVVPVLSYTGLFWRDHKRHQVVISDELRSKCSIVYNGYGYETQRVARILAEHLGLSYKQIELYNNGSVEGILWINHYRDNDGNVTGSSRQFIVGPVEAIEKVEVCDLNLDEIESDDEETWLCEHCDGTIYNEDGIYHNPNGDIYCQDCYEEHVTVCDKCSRTVWSDETNSVYGRWGQSTWCNRCMEREAFRCYNCEEMYGTDYDSGTEVDGEEYCENCLEKECFVCKSCKEYHLNGQESEQEEVCQDCAEKEQEND